MNTHESTTNVETITPQQARQWLRSSHQRNIDLMKSRLMLDALEANTWDVAVQANNPVVVITSRNTIANGHHRLIAILMRGCAVDCVVERRP